VRRSPRRADRIRVLMCPSRNRASCASTFPESCRPWVAFQRSRPDSIAQADGADSTVRRIADHEMAATLSVPLTKSLCVSPVPPAPGCVLARPHSSTMRARCGLAMHPAVLGHPSKGPR
jgi:hypothetical protein